MSDPARSPDRSGSALPIDPRISERRVAVRRDAGRRRLRQLVWGTGMVALTASAYGATRSRLLDVDTVRIEGATRVDVDEVPAAGGLDRRPQLIDVDPAAVATRIERLPWVKTAAVVRRWPGTVEVSLVERTPVAVVAGGPAWSVVDASGRVLEQVAEPPPGMPRIDSPDLDLAPGLKVGREARSALGLLDRLPPSLQGRVSVIRAAPGPNLQLQLEGGPPVNVGPPEQLRPKLVALSTLVAKANLRGVKMIDVRVPTAPVLTRT